MAVALDTAVTQTAGSGPSITWNHACTGSDLILVVAVLGNSTDNVTGVTYNGVSLTLAAKVQQTNWLYLFYLVAPATGTHAVVVSKTSGTMTGSSASYTGAKQSGQPDATGTYTGTSESADRTVSITTVLAGCWLVATHGSTLANPASVVSGTERVTLAADADIIDSNGSVGAAGAHTIGYHWNALDNHNIVGLSIAPAPLSRTASTSVSSSASRLAAVARLGNFFRTGAISVSNSVSRLATAARAFIFTKAISVTVSNAASRLATIFSHLRYGWSNTTKNSSSYTDQTKNTSSYSSQSKNSSNWTNLPKD